MLEQGGKGGWDEVLLPGKWSGSAFREIWTCSNNFLNPEKHLHVLGI